MITWFKGGSQQRREAIQRCATSEQTRTTSTAPNRLCNSHLLCVLHSIGDDMDSTKYNLRNPAVKRIMQVSSTWSPGGASSCPPPSGHMLCCRRCGKYSARQVARLWRKPWRYLQLKPWFRFDELSCLASDTYILWGCRTTYLSGTLLFVGLQTQSLRYISPAAGVTYLRPVAHMHTGCYTKQPLRRLQGGVYHGRIILPPEYPFKPPSFIMISPSGRFETGVKICLSMSSHHPEHWQPSWSVRVALVALIAFLPTSGHGAIGSLVNVHLAFDSTHMLLHLQQLHSHCENQCTTARHLLSAGW